MNLNEVFAQVKSLSLEDQRALNKMLVANLNHAAKMKSLVAAGKFNLGDKVQFDAGRKGMVTIEVDGFSRDMTKLKGKQIAGWSRMPNTNWTVAASLCSKV